MHTFMLYFLSKMSNAILPCLSYELWTGSAFFASTPPVNQPTELTRAEVRRQSRAYGIVSKVITCIMWLIRLLWNILTTVCGTTVSLLRSMFDCPAQGTSGNGAGGIPLPSFLSNNFCEEIQHPVTRARLVAEYRAYFISVALSNNFIGKSCLLICF